jgi:anti-sigma regulatory factor (Ser/Thr protein kinase)
VVDRERRPVTPLLSLHLASPRTADAGPARHAVRDCVAAVCDAATVDDAELVAGELIANAVLHAPGPIRVDVAHTGDELRIAVTDHHVDAVPEWEPTGDADDDPPSIDHGTRGRGLAIVTAVAADWGWVIDADEGTKTVHATLTCAAATPAEPLASADRR